MDQVVCDNEYQREEVDEVRIKRYVLKMVW